MFEWLTELGRKKKKKDIKKKSSAPSSNCHVKVDSRTYPLINLTPKAFMAGEADANLAKNQNLAISVVVDDAFGKFTFDSRCTIVNIDSSGRFAGAFSILPLEVEQVLIRYQKNRTAQAAAKGR
jgi:hypothetical protein